MVVRSRDFFLKSRVARRVFGLFVLCAVVPLCGLAFVTYLRVSDQLEQLEDDRLRWDCETAAQAIAQQLRVLEARLPFGEPRLGSTSPEWRSLVVAEAGDASPSSTETVRIPELSEAVRAHVDSGKTGIAVDPLDRSVWFVRRLGPERTLFAEIDAEALWRDLAFAVDLLVVTRDGVRLFESSAAVVSSTTIQAEMAERPAVGGLAWEDGESAYIGRYKSVYLVPEFGVDWIVAFSSEKSDMLAPIYAFKKDFALIVLLTFWSVAILSSTLIRRSLVPIEQLREGTDRLAAGDYDTPVSIDSGDEFQDLGESFNTMARRIVERTQQLERASRAKMEFLANMSHELRTPMTAILGYLDLCRDPGIDDQELRAYLAIIESNGKHLLRVINDVLDVSKAEADRMTVEHERCSPEEIVRGVIDLMGPIASDKGLRLDLELEPGLPPYILSDSVRLKQILLNVVGNALKFTSEGAVGVQVGTAVADDRRQIVFTVRDTGEGMTEEQLEAIFDPFVQADTSTTRRFGGTGLGLAISRTLAVALGGGITCESELAVGSTFVISIDAGTPAHLDVGGEARADGVEESAAASVGRDRESEGAPGEERPLAHVGRPVLLVEDVPVNRKLAKIVLTKAGLEVDEAENGAIAVDMALAALEAGRPYAVVLMDIQMPVMDGLTATRTLREQGYDHPIVALTSHSMPEERTRCFDVGCDGLAGKPIDKPELFGLIARLAGGSDETRPAA